MIYVRYHSIVTHFTCVKMRGATTRVRTDHISPQHGIYKSRVCHVWIFHAIYTCEFSTQFTCMDTHVYLQHCYLMHLYITSSNNLLYVSNFMKCYSTGGIKHLLLLSHSYSFIVVHIIKYKFNSTYCYRF